MTGETFSNAPTNNLTGSYSYFYDQRGQQTTSTLTVGSNTYPLGSTFDDAGNLLTQTYPDGEVVTNSLGAQGWLSGVSTLNGAANTTLLAGITYTGTGGAYGFMTSANTYPAGSFNFGYDLLGRLNSISDVGVGTYFSEQLNFDAAGNASTISSNLAGATDNQGFCYDEQNRLTWAASTGTAPCPNVTITTGTITPTYSQTFAYDTLGRLTSGPLGAYTYGAPAHMHAATAIGGAYTATYDASGDMTCRAPSASTTCGGTQTGAQLTYNNQGQLSTWQNQPSGPTATGYLYDGQGNRVAQQTTLGSTTTTTVYTGGVEEDTSINGGLPSHTIYYYANGRRIAVAVNGTFNYLATDALGSATVAVAQAYPYGVTATTLYAPYGSVRYFSGTMPTDHGFTGQIADSTGLDYYGARYYDPVAGQFASADTVIPGSGLDMWGLSRYAYVEGNPVNRVDPTGHCTTTACWLDANRSDNTTHMVAGEDKPASHNSSAPPPSFTPPSARPAVSRRSGVGLWLQNNAAVRLPSNWSRFCVVPQPFESPVGGF